MSTLRFYGQIAGVGSFSGIRIVVGRWSKSPLGTFGDVMLETADGHRLLLAPSDDVAQFIADTYEFDEVQIVPVSIVGVRIWNVVAGELSLTIRIGIRNGLGLLLRLVPQRLAAQPWWNKLLDPIARGVLRGVRTQGSARSGRREYYGAHDQRAVAAISGTWRGSDLGSLRAVKPPVRFGFSSTPATPSVTSVVTTVVDRAQN